MPVDDTQLAVLAVSVRFRQAAHDVAGGTPFSEQHQPPRTITQVGPRLGGDRACAGLRPRDNRPNGQELAGHRHPELAGLEVRGGDRKSRRRDS